MKNKKIREVTRFVLGMAIGGAITSMTIGVLQEKRLADLRRRSRREEWAK